MINEISVESGYNNGIICLLQERPLASRYMDTIDFLIAP